MNELGWCLCVLDVSGGEYRCGAEHDRTDKQERQQPYESTHRSLLSLFLKYIPALFICQLFSLTEEQIGVGRGAAQACDRSRKSSYHPMTLATVTAASLVPVPKVEAACSLHCGLCGVYVLAVDVQGPSPSARAGDGGRTEGRPGEKTPRGGTAGLLFVRPLCPFPHPAAAVSSTGAGNRSPHHPCQTGSSRAATSSTPSPYR